MEVNSATIAPARMKLAAEFFAESMAAFEISLRGYRESNARLVASNEELGKANATARAAIKDLEGIQLLGIARPEGTAASRRRLLPDPARRLCRQARC